MIQDAKQKTEHRMASIVLGVNDGLIELTGALVGFTFAFKDAKVVALTGLITGIAAALSMASSAFMQARHETGKNASKAALLTGVSYLVVVLSLVAPYFFATNVFVALPIMFVIVFTIIAIISYYNSVFLEKSFPSEFGIMFIFSMGVAAVSFALGSIVQSILTISK